MIEKIKKINPIELVGTFSRYINFLDNLLNKFILMGFLNARIDIFYYL